MTFFKVLFFSLLLFAVSVSADDIRILLKRSVSEALFSSDSTIKVQKMDGTSLSQLVSGRAHRLTPKAGKINAGMQTLSASMIMLKSDNVIRFNNNPYRGSMLVFVENGKMNVVNEIDIEEYLYGVVPREVSESWTEEIIKTQAVLARTFALNGKYRARRGALFDLDDSTLSQVYTGYAAENGKVNRLVDITRSEVLMFGNKLAEVYYHSCCGGMTEDVGSVWGRNLTYLRSVPCDYCVDTSNYKWVYKISRELFAKKMAAHGKRGEPRNLHIRRLTRSHRVAEIEIQDNDKAFVMKGNDFRNMLGTTEIRSLLFTVKCTEDGFEFTGHGWGHGIGLCQWGGKTMSDKGQDYRYILKYYYRGTRLVKFSPALLE